MQYTKWFAGLALALGMGFASAPALSAAEPYGRDAYRDRQELRSDYRETSRDYARISRLRAEIAADRARLNDDIRRGRQWAARRDRAELARDQRMLDALLRDSHYDWNDHGRRGPDASFSYRER